MDVGEIISKESLPQNQLPKQLHFKRFRKSILL
jgi:hypothetical protein